MSTWAHRMTQPVLVASVASRSRDGDPTYGAVRTVPCRVESGATYGRATGDNATLGTGSTTLYAQEPILEDDRIWLPGSDPLQPSEARLPSSVTAVPALDGTVYVWQVTL